MSASRQQIESIATRIAEQTGAEHGYEIVDVEYVKEHGDYFLRIYIDKEGGVGLDDCQLFSQSFSEIFDPIDPIPGSYSLEISSPGVERPLKRARDYERFSGHMVNVKTYAPVMGRKRFKGVLEGLHNESVIVQVDNDHFSIPLSMISSARLVADFQENLRQGAKKR